MRSKSARRRARRHNAFVENVDKKTLWERHGGLCGLCFEPVAYDEMTIEHITPLSRGGKHSYANCVVAHESCNLAKGSLTLEEYLAVA